MCKFSNSLASRTHVFPHLWKWAQLVRLGLQIPEGYKENMAHNSLALTMYYYFTVHYTSTDFIYSCV